MVCIATVTWPRLSGAAAPLMIDQKRRNETVAAARQANQQARAGRKSKLVNSRPGQVCLPFPPLPVVSCSQTPRQPSPVADGRWWAFLRRRQRRPRLPRRRRRRGGCGLRHR